eukprot:2956695-Rhodomonas_salina.1
MFICRSITSYDAHSGTYELNMNTNADRARKWGRKDAVDLAKAMKTAPLTRYDGDGGARWWVCRSISCNETTPTFQGKLLPGGGRKELDENQLREHLRKAGQGAMTER